MKLNELGWVEMPNGWTRLELLDPAGQPIYLSLDEALIFEKLK